MTNIYFHADDYGISPSNSKKYINLLQNGTLDSLSILPNSQYFEECSKLFLNEIETFPKMPLYSVHINLVDGLSVSAKSLPLLQDKNHCIKTSWSKLFAISFLPSPTRQKYKEQLKTEIHAQIKKVTTTYNFQKSIRIDSHMHTHMIPLVSEALCEVIIENQLPVDFIRITREPLHLFLHHKKYLITYPLINYIKNIILNLFSPQLEKKMTMMSLPTPCLFGVMMSGNMNKERVPYIIKTFMDYSSKHNKNLEILFHPGQMDSSELGIAQNKKEINNFYISDNRNIEYECIKSMH